MASGVDPSIRGRSTVRTEKSRSMREQSQEREPNMSEWRIILLGKNLTENSSVGELLSRTAVFKSEGRQEERYIKVIKTPDLLNPNLSLRQLSRGVRESLSQSAPGPHAFILVLQHNDFTEEDRYRVKSVLKEFSKRAIKYTTVMTTDDALRSRFSFTGKDISELIKECGGRHLQFHQKTQNFLKIFETIVKIIKENNEEYILNRAKEKMEESTTSEDSAREENSEDSDQEDDRKQELRHTGKKEEKGLLHRKPRSEPYWDSTVQNPRRDWPKRGASFIEKKTLNLVLCGSDRTLKSTISKHLRGKNKNPLTSHQRVRTEVCVKKKGKLNGRLINVVEFPALSSTQLLEDEVIHESLYCVSLCDPGVHVFLIVIPVGPLTDEDKAEMEMIQTIFNSRDHFMVLFTTDITIEKSVTDFIKHTMESERFLSFCGGQYRVLGLKDQEKSKQISELLDYIKNNKTEPYSLYMYIKAKENKIRHELQQKADEDSGCLRVVLIGKTGNGKSETGNTILGGEAFHAETSLDSVTTVCVKAVGEVQGKSIAVVDTPGLFDTKLSNEHVQEEIVKCISLSAPGPHVFIIVLSVRRFTKEEMETLSMIKMIFGSKAAQFSIVLFTGGDDLKNNTIEQCVENSRNAELKKLIRDCGNRVLVFNNRDKQDRTQVTKLLNMIEDVKKCNHGQYFTNEMFQEAEMSIRKRMEEILKEKEREIQLQNEELKAKYETEMENMMKRLEEEKKRADEERLLMESKFREKEETLRKEFEEKEKSEQKKREMEDQKRSEEDKQQKAEYEQKFEEMRQETENLRSQYEKQLNETEEEDKRRENKYIQDQEKLKKEQKQVIAEILKKQKEETDKRDLEKKKWIKIEDEERQQWERKIKEAENDKIEIQEDIKQQQREWEEKLKLQMRDREEEEKMRKDRHTKQLREKQDELDRLREMFEREREEERRIREDERQQFRDTERREREQKESEYEEKKNEMKRQYEQLEQKRKAEWERINQEHENRREEERKRWKKMIEDLKQEQEEEIKRRETEEKARKEKEEKERDEMKQKHEEEMEKMKKKHEDEARKHAEEFNEFRDKKEQHIQELRQMLEEYQKEREVLEKLYLHFQKEIQEATINKSEGKKKETCLIM